MSKNKAHTKRKAIVKAYENDLTARRTDSMISRITIRDVATFSHEGVTLDDLQRVNFIFGRNGCGKTTISRVLATPNRYKNCEITWTDKSLKTLVYNRDFRDKNLQENIPGVFTLGEDSVVAEKNLETLQKKLDIENQNLKAKQKRIDAKTQKEEREKQKLIDTLWNEVFLPQNELFGLCLKNEVVTSSPQFARLMTAKVEDGSYRKAQQQESLLERYKTLFLDENLEIIRPLEKPEEPYEVLTEIEGNEIWLRSIVNKDEDAEVCPYCHQKIVTEGQRTYGEYKDDVETIRSLAERYKEHADQLAQKLSIVANLCELKTGETGHAGKMAAKLELLTEKLDTNYRIMMNKLEKPVMVTQFKDIQGTVNDLWQMIDEANAEIEAHNNMVENLNPERERLSEDVMTYLASRSASAVKLIRQSISQIHAEQLLLKKEAEEIQARVTQMVEGIKGLEMKLASTKPTVERINHELRRYEFSGFSIQPSRKGNYYQIQREDGSLVKDTLSEGETTFITFLYYLQLVKGGESNDHVKERKVLVIDDPMSSLDNNMMGVVSEMVRQLIQRVNGLHASTATESDINQIFVLSHSTDFYNRVARVNPRGNKRRGVHHWLLDKRGTESRVTAYGMENPVRMGYDQLWMDLKTAYADGRPIQNKMRKIIDTYFVEFGGYDNKNHVVASFFKDDEVERIRMTAFMEWLDKGSHSGDDALYGEPPRVENPEKMELFRQLFEKTGHGAHYKMMMRED